MMGITQDLAIGRGETFSRVVRWESAPIVYKPITAISLAYGAPRLTVASHGMPNGWRCAVSRVQGMTQINAANSPPKDRDYLAGTVIDANTVELNTVSPCDAGGAEWPAYTSGGFLQYNTPHDLAGYTAKLDIKDKVGGTVLLSLTTENGGIAIDNAEKSITLKIDEAVIDALTWKKGVYNLDVTSPDDFVTELMNGAVIVEKE